jgi:cephalosporin hydroxylase
LAEFATRNRAMIARMAEAAELHELSRKWFEEASRFEYSYHFTWLGRPIIQFPQDILAVQEIIWRTTPDLIIETGIAHGGSLILSASCLELIGGNGTVLGIDVDIREHNRREIEVHPLFKRIVMLEGSSVAQEIVEKVRAAAEGRERIMVMLDSNHTRDHVLKELQIYSPLVTKGCYLVVFDTIIEDLPRNFFSDRPWDRGDNPKTAVQQFLNSNDRFVIDKEIDSKLLITVAPSGYLRCVKD